MTKEELDQCLKANYECACNLVLYLYDKIKDKYNVELISFLTYQNQFKISNKSLYEIKFKDLKENNSLSISAKLVESEYPWILHLWKYPKGEHIFKSIEMDFRNWELKDYMREIDTFFFEKEQLNQVSIFDLIGE